MTTSDEESRPSPPTAMHVDDQLAALADVRFFPEPDATG
jgi:hypothetical protein